MMVNPDVNGHTKLNPNIVSPENTPKNAQKQQPTENQRIMS